MAVFYHDKGALLVSVGLARQLIRVRTSGRIHDEPRSYVQWCHCYNCPRIGDSRSRV